MTALTMLVFGEGGTGKSTLFETAPGPRLLIDSENKAGLLEGTTVFWDDLSVCPILDESTTYVLKCTSYKSVMEIVKLLHRHGTKFKSFGVDSWSRLQQHLGSELTAKGLDGWDYWAELKSQTIFLLDALAGLAEDHADIVYGVCWLHESDGKFQPLMEGSVKNLIGHYAIVVGRPTLKFSSTGITQNLHIFPGIIEDNEGRLEEKTSTIKTNSMTLLKKYGKVIKNPSLTEIHQVLNKQLVK